MGGEGRPAKSDTGKLDDRAAVRYLLGYKYEGGDRVRIPKLGVQETRDVVFYEGEAPMTLVDGRIIKSRRAGGGSPSYARMWCGLHLRPPPAALPVPHR